MILYYHYSNVIVDLSVLRFRTFFFTLIPAFTCTWLKQGQTGEIPIESEDIILER